MKVYQVFDDGELVLSTADMAELGKAFVKLSAKHEKNDWYWLTEVTL